MNKLHLALAVCALGLAVGCDKKVQLTFVNGTNEQLDVQLNLPTEGSVPVGMAGPSGGRAHYDVKIPKDELPANCSWQAGSYGGQFTISEKSDKKLFIFIDRGGNVGPVNEKTEVQRENHTEVKDQVIDQYPVVK